jgi:hypothetical protein
MAVASESVRLTTTIGFLPLRGSGDSSSEAIPDKVKGPPHPRQEHGRFVIVGESHLPVLSLRWHGSPSVF